MKNNKKIFAASLAILGAVALSSCDAKPNNLSIPYGSLGDTIYASAQDGKYSITEKQLYTKLRQNGYDSLTKKIYSIVFDENIQDTINKYATDKDTQKSINDSIALACYSTSSPSALKKNAKEEDSIKESKAKYIQTMAAAGVIVTEKDLEFTISDDNSDNRLDTISFPNLNKDHALVKYYAYDLGLKNAAIDYFESIANEEKIYDYSKEEMVDNTNFIDEEILKTKYNDAYKEYNTTKAIIVRFNSARDAQNAIEAVEAKVGKLTKENALEFYVNLYNTYYSYRTPLTITDGKLTDANSLTYISDEKNTELNSISTNFKTFYQDALVDGGFDKATVKEGSYTAFPRSIDDKYFMVYRIETKYQTGTAEAVDFDELETVLGADKTNEILDELKDKVIESRASASTATSTIFKNLLIDGNNDKEADDVLDIKIYDPYYEYKFYTTYADADYYDYITKKDFNNDLIATVTFNGKSHDISVADFYTELADKSGAKTATTYLLNQYLTETYKDKFLDEDDLETIDDSFEASVKSFKNDETSYPKFLGLETFYTINYGYSTKEEIYTQNLYANLLTSKYASTNYRDEYFISTPDSYTINEEVKAFQNLLDYTAKVYQTLYTIDLSHFLISVDDNCDGTIDDPQEFMAELSDDEKVKFQNAVVELSQALIAEANYITTDKLTALKYLVKAYNQGLALQSPNYVGKTWDDFKYSYNFKVTVENLGEITQDTSSSYVKPFASYIEETYKQVVQSNLNFDDDKTYFFINGLTQADGTTDASKIKASDLCETVYGYHVLIVNDFDEPTNAYYSQSSDTNKDYESIKVIVDEKDEDDDNDDIYFVTNAYNESTTNISMNQFYIYFYEQLVDGSVTSLSSNLKKSISAMASNVISRYTNSSFKTWLALDELGEIKFNDTESMTYTYDDYIYSLEVAVDGYTPNDTYAGWFDKEWK